MSKWTHSICTPCWEFKNPNRPATKFTDDTLQTCCFCGNGTSDGIYVRESPDLLRCEGIHDKETGQ